MPPAVCSASQLGALGFFYRKGAGGVKKHPVPHVLISISAPLLNA